MCHGREVEPVEYDIAEPAVVDVPHQDPVAIAFGGRLRKRAGTGHSALAGVEPFPLRVPIRDLGHLGHLRCWGCDLRVDHLIGRKLIQAGLRHEAHPQHHLAGVRRILAGSRYLFAALLMFILIITIPFAIQAVKLAVFALWPFGRTVVKRADAGAPSLVGNILWLVLAGWWLAIGHLVTGVALCITIIGFRSHSATSS